MILTDEQIRDILYQQGTCKAKDVMGALTELQERYKAVAQAEHEATLRAVGNILVQPCNHPEGRGFMVWQCNRCMNILIEALKRGEMP